MARLRTETRDAHVAAEGTALAASILDGSFSPAAYRAQVGFYLAVYEAVEARLETEHEPRLSRV